MFSHICSPRILVWFSSIHTIINVIYYISSFRVHPPMIVVGMDDPGTMASSRLQIFEYHEDTRYIFSYMHSRINIAVTWELGHCKYCCSRAFGAHRNLIPSLAVLYSLHTALEHTGSTFMSYDRCDLLCEKWALHARVDLVIITPKGRCG